MSIAERLQQWFGVGTGIPHSLRRELQVVRRLQSQLATTSSRTPVEEFRSLRYQLRVRPQDASLHCAGLATACWASELALGLRPHDVQVLAALALRRGVMIEMATGEGKTLVAALAGAVSSLAGEGVHVATANDYLATRDAHWGSPLYQTLGLRVASIAQSLPRSRRGEAYRADITYSTARELAFDFLRDRLALRARREAQLLFAGQSGSASDPASRPGRPAEAAEEPVQRGLRRALLDEADSLLLDEARVPLIISGPVADAAQRVALARWAANLARELRETADFEHDPREHRVELTDAGRQRVRRAVTPEIERLTNPELEAGVELAVRVERELIRDRHYVIRQQKIVIVDEFTGRLAEGRQWRGGQHQAVEAREGVPVTPPGETTARITVQEFFAGYEQLAGMTGTALDGAREFRTFYQRPVIVIPTHRPCRREIWPTRVLATTAQKFAAICAEVAELRDRGRPVLVGTRSIDRSEELSQALREAGIPHEVLHARRLAAEAELVAQAGQRGRITIATNMAGRGTDILLGAGVAELGGLHVIGTELHDSARVDRQLFGRCARQGDPGSVRQFLALDDDLLDRGLSAAQCRTLREGAQRKPGDCDALAPWFLRAQRAVERQQFEERRWLVRQTKRRRAQIIPAGFDPYLDLLES